MYRYYVRPGYGSGKLMIEFIGLTEGPEFWLTLESALAPLNAHLERAVDLWVNDTMLYEYRSNTGRFTVSEDIWGFVFLEPLDNAPTLYAIDAALVWSGRFRCDETDWRKYERRADS